MNYFYPSDQQALFNNRRQELALLDHCHRSLIHGPMEHVALFGLRRIGKSLLLAAEPMDLKDLIQRLDQQFQRVLEELGDARESTVRELMHYFNGQTAPEEVFHSRGVLILPVFEDVKEEVSSDGQVELDAIGEGPERWAVEVKWRNKRAGHKELEKLLKNAQERKARAWYVPRSSFTADAIQYALENEILITDQKGLEILRKQIL